MKYRDMFTPPTQRERADERQVVNSAGGYVYEIDKAARLRRFLVLGTEGGTFYASQKDLTKTNVDFLKAYAAKDPAKYLATLIEVDSRNVAPRHSTVLLALAVLYAHAPNVRPSDGKSVEAVEYDTHRNIEFEFTKIVRTGTHLFEFIDYVTMYRGWGRGLRRLVASWYTEKSPKALAYQVVKYRHRS